MYTHLDFIFIVQSVTVCIFVSFQIMEMLTDYKAQYATLLVKKIHNVSVWDTFTTNLYVLEKLGYINCYFRFGFQLNQRNNRHIASRGRNKTGRKQKQNDVNDILQSW